MSRGQDSTLAARIGLFAAGLTIVISIGAGFISWGGLSATVGTLQAEVKRKADAETVTEIREDVRYIRQRLDRWLEKGKTK